MRIFLVAALAFCAAFARAANVQIEGDAVVRPAPELPVLPRALSAASLDRIDVAGSIKVANPSAMTTVRDGSAQLVLLTPPPAAATQAGRKQDARSLREYMAEVNRVLKPDGVLAVAVADPRGRDGAVYPRHDAIEDAARWAGLEVFNHQVAITSFDPDPAAQAYSHVLLLRRAGAKEKRTYTQQFLEEPWLATKSDPAAASRAAGSADIARILIESFSSGRDRVVSMFAGSGVSVAVGKALGRDAAGYEPDARLARAAQRPASEIVGFGPARARTVAAAPVLQNGWSDADVRPPSPEEVLATIKFHTALEMPEVKTHSAKVVFATPPYLGVDKEGQAKDAELLRGFFKEAERVLAKDGALVTFQTDYRGGPKGTLYLRHDAVRRAAEAAGFEVIDQKIRVRRFSRDLFRKGYSHMQIMRRKGERPELRPTPGFSRDAWVLPVPKSPDYRDATPPEIYEMALRRLTDPKDLVVNGFAGSGTGNIVALGLGRRVVGYELNRGEIPLIRKRTREIGDLFSRRDKAPETARDGGRLAAAPLAAYVRASATLPQLFNVLALRDFQRRAGLPRFAKLDARFSASFKAIYGAKGSDQLATSLGSPIKTTLGTGWMGRIISLRDGRTIKTIIREGSRTSKIGILFETEAWMTYHLQKNQRRYGIKVLPIISVGPNGMYLEKPFVDSKTIGSQILKANKKLTRIQLERLRNLHQNAIRLAEETGIPLDLKADNVFWDGSDWVLLDPVGSISQPTSYGKTLDVRDFDDFYSKWTRGKKPVGKGLAIDQVVKQFPEIRGEYDRSKSP